ncbi:hypothetical protein LXL04_014136 [Taraxacum kok-saghyz]
MKIIIINRRNRNKNHENSPKGNQKHENRKINVVGEPDFAPVLTGYAGEASLEDIVGGRRRRRRGIAGVEGEESLEECATGVRGAKTQSRSLLGHNRDCNAANEALSLSIITSGVGKENPAALLSIFPDPVVLLLFSGEALLSVVLLSIFFDPEKLFFPDPATTLSRRASLSRFSVLAVVILPHSRSGELLFPDSQRRFLNLSIFWISAAPFSACASFLVLIPPTIPATDFWFLFWRAISGSSSGGSDSGVSVFVFCLSDSGVL